VQGWRGPSTLPCLSQQYLTSALQHWRGKQLGIWAPMYMAALLRSEGEPPECVRDWSLALLPEQSS
jgi:hypothetical protein